MNERIKELALQADLIRYKSDEINIKIEKFAELIVQECAGLADNCPANYLSQPHKYPSTYIKEHFGVEE